MLVGTNMMNIYHHRIELINVLIHNGFRVLVAAPEGEEVKSLVKSGCEFIHLDVDNRGTNIRNDIKLISNIKKICKKEKPDIILTFYTKTNIYAGIVARYLKIPYIENITGLGSALAKGKGLLYRLMSKLYKYAIGRAYIVFFQNESNYKFFYDRNLYRGKYKMLPGSGVNIEKYKALPYPDETPVSFLFISRILREKGIGEYLKAAEIIRNKRSDAVFHVAGPCDPSCKEIIEKAKQTGLIEYHGKVEDIEGLLNGIHCTVLPSYYPEGMANVLLESAASGRPIITTSLPGCGETADDGTTGFIVRERSAGDLAEKIERFLDMDYGSKKEMGNAGRRKMEREFNREIVISAYLQAINEILELKKSL